MTQRTGRRAQRLDVSHRYLHDALGLHADLAAVADIDESGVLAHEEVAEVPFTFYVEKRTPSQALVLGDTKCHGAAVAVMVREAELEARVARMVVPDGVEPSVRKTL